MAEADIDLTLLKNVNDPELRIRLESLGRSMAKREAQQRTSEPEKRTAKVIQLPLWPEPVRGVPNEILRSALFAAIQGKERKHVKQYMVASYEGVRIKYTGELLDQSDLDVWEQVVHLARKHPLGTECHFTAHGFLRAIGRCTGKKDHKWLHSVLLRLQTCAVEIYKGKSIYSRSLITGFDIEDMSRHIKVIVDPDMLEVYTIGWTGIDWEQRQQLRGKPLALWLLGYYASHAAPLPVKVDTLRQLCGSKAKTLRSFRQQLREALDVLKEDHIRAIEDCYIDDDDLVYVDRGKAITATQRRHLTRPKRARKPKR